MGLDIGVSSVGMAVIFEEKDQITIQKLAVRAVPEEPDFHGKFYSGNTASKNLDRRTKRGIRRNNQRFKLRRARLYKVLRANGMFPDKALFELDTLELFRLRAHAAESKLTLPEIGRVLIHLNQKRGFKSNRKANKSEDQDSQFKQTIRENEEALGQQTIGQQLFAELSQIKEPNEVKLKGRTYFRSSYIEEFNKIWTCQQQYYPDLLTGDVNAEDIKGTLLKEIRDTTIFFQRPLKSQKDLVGKCRFEKNHKAASTSSPYFEMFRILQQVNDLDWKDERGEKHQPTPDQRKALFDRLFWADKLNASNKLTWNGIKRILGFSTKDKIYPNFKELLGSKTVSAVKKALESAGISDTTPFLQFDHRENDPQYGLYKLWHTAYSIDSDRQVAATLAKYFDLSDESATTLAQNLYFDPDYGSLSTKAIRKLLPHMINGKSYFEACEAVGYDHSGYKTEIPIQEKLASVHPNELRNPVAEQVLNQMVNMVNQAIDLFGKFDEIRVELARELKNSAKVRKDIFSKNNQNSITNDYIRQRLKNEYGMAIVNGRDVRRYKLWEETEHICLYCCKPVTNSDFLKGQADTDHILPKSRTFTNAMDNFVLVHNQCNRDKGQQTAFDYMTLKGSAALDLYLKTIQDLFDKKKIGRRKLEYLTCTGADIPNDFVKRMLKDTQYISKEAVSRLKTVCEKTYTTTGQITDFLRKEWGLDRVLEELNFPKYKDQGLTETRFKKGNGETHTYEAITDWTKRNDHRHHAVDALVTALTKPGIILRLNNLNKLYQKEIYDLSFEEFQEMEKELGRKFDLKEFADQTAFSLDVPVENLRQQAREHLSGIFISFKKSNSKALSPGKNEFRTRSGTQIQKTWVPRGSLHKDTVLGQKIVPEKIPLTQLQNLDQVINPQQKSLIEAYTLEFDHNFKKAFSKKNLKTKPLLWKGEPLDFLWVKKNKYSKRVNLSSLTVAQVDKIADEKVKDLVKERIEKYDGIKKAFADLTNDPLFLNKEARIKIFSVTVFENDRLYPVRQKRDHRGVILGKEGMEYPNDFVALGNNHHALVYEDEKGNARSKLISFWDAVESGLQNIREQGSPYPIINRRDDPTYGTFKYSMQINDLFTIDLFHSETPENENEINFWDPINRAKISQCLFRVQTISSTDSGSLDIRFRHHLETKVERNEKALRGITWDRFSSDKNLSRLTKVKINHLGEIIKIGE